MGPHSGPMLWVAAEECRNCIELHHSRGTSHGTLSSRRCEGFGTRRGQAGRVANGAPPFPSPSFPHMSSLPALSIRCVQGWLAGNTWWLPEVRVADIPEQASTWIGSCRATPPFGLETVVEFAENDNGSIFCLITPTRLETWFWLLLSHLLVVGK